MVRNVNKRLPLTAGYCTVHHNPAHCPMPSSWSCMICSGACGVFEVLKSGGFFKPGPNIDPDAVPWRHESFAFSRGFLWKN